MAKYFLFLCFMFRQRKKFIQLLVLSLFIIQILFFNFKTATAEPLISETIIFKLINKKRVENNIHPLIINNKLAQAAIDKAKYLYRNNYFDHESKNGQKTFSYWIKETNYKYSFAGENLATNFKNNNDIIQAWMNSSSHQENLLNENYLETGIAVYKNIVVQIFGRPAEMPMSIQKTIGNHISENLILYISQGNKLHYKLETNNLA